MFLRLLLLTMALPAHAAEMLVGKVGTITGDDWALSGLEVSIGLSGSTLRGQVRVGKLVLETAGQSFSDVVVDCGHVGLTTAEFACQDAELTIDLPGVGRRTFPADGAYERGTGIVHFDLRQVPIAEGLARVSGTLGATAIDIRFSGKALQIAGLASMAKGLALGPDDLAASGSVDINGALRTEDGEGAQVTMHAELSEASIANNLGTLVTASMHSLIDVAATRRTKGWQFTASFAADAGEAYIEPVYANLAEGPVSISADGSVAGGFDELELRKFSLIQGSVLDASGNLRIEMPQAREAAINVSGTIEINDSSIEAIYSGLLQVWAAGTLFGDLDTAGTVSGTVEVENNALAAIDLVLQGLDADDKQGRFGIYGLNGSIHWPGPGADAKDAEISRIHWSGASAYSILFGGGSIEARLGGDDFVLLQAIRLPTMGGALRINRLSVTDFGADDASGLLDAELEPIELGQLTAAFGWPAFSGSLSGKLPLLQYEDGVMTLGGTLAAKAFDGNIEFANLKLEQPFGLVPRLYGDLRLRQLDLELVTNTFSFGLIQGRLSGDVTGLEMVTWRPVAMDLHLYTPPGDSSRHRISQRAIENLASVGGGGGAALALSSGFMKFFDDFAYEKIGIRCVLHDGVCEMSGAGPAGRDQLGGGYYIVKGSGLPRIDVVGYRSQVSWSRLVRQLVNITESGAPVVD